MHPSRLMTTPVTISRPAAPTGTDVLGRPIPGPPVQRATTCRLVRRTTSTPDPNVDGLLVAVLEVYLPLGTALSDADTLTIAGAAYQIIGMPEVLTTPAGQGYEKATVRLVRDAA